MKIGRLKNYDGLDQFAPLDVLNFETSLYYHTHTLKLSQTSRPVGVPIQRAKPSGGSGLQGEKLRPSFSLRARVSSKGYPPFIFGALVHADSRLNALIINCDKKVLLSQKVFRGEIFNSPERGLDNTLGQL